MSPLEADDERNGYAVRNRFEQRYIGLKRQQPTLAVGDLVRITTGGNTFKRIYQAQSTEEVFVVGAVCTKHKIPTYMLTNLAHSEQIDGVFRAFELSKLSPQAKFAIRKVLRKNKNRHESLVVFNGLSDDVRSWVDTDRVTQALNAGNAPQFQPLLKYV